MANTEINNQIILLRHVVRQARVCVVNKLIREAKQLRNKHGNEMQQKKYKNKADRFIAEVYALKGIKDDDISKYGIINKKCLNHVLQDQSSSTSTRIIARVTHYKPLHKKFIQFREQFPYYKKYFTEREKKVIKSKNKNIKIRSENMQDHHVKVNKKRKTNNSDKDVAYFECNTQESFKTKVKDNVPECEYLTEQNMLLTKPEKDSTPEDIIVNKQADVIQPHGITKEASVKRFTELLEEEKSIENIQILPESTNITANIITVQEKIIDDFFITKDNENYITASTSYAKFHKNNTQTGAVQSNIKIQEQNSKYKNERRNFSKTERYNKLENKLKVGNVKENKQSFTRQEKRAFKKNDKMIKDNLDDVNNRKNPDLHPSWMAKKKQQEIMNQGFQGKKILFTDD